MLHTTPTRKQTINHWLGVGLVALGALMALSAFSPMLAGEIFAIFAPVTVGLLFTAVYVNNDYHRWALIPAYFAFATAGLVLCVVLGIRAGFVAAYAAAALAAFVSFSSNHPHLLT